jgi:ATP-dependent Clp protease ATP-binding subunit ClpB
LTARLENRRLELVVTDEAKDRIAEWGFDPVYGARPLKRVIQRELADALAVKLLDGTYVDGDRIEVTADAAGLRFSEGAIRA